MFVETKNLDSCLQQILQQLSIDLDDKARADILANTVRIARLDELAMSGSATLSVRSRRQMVETSLALRLIETLPYDTGDADPRVAATIALSRDLAELLPADTELNKDIRVGVAVRRPFRPSVTTDEINAWLAEMMGILRPLAKAAAYCIDAHKQTVDRLVEQHQAATKRAAEITAGAADLSW
jgi:hypothetical protein